MSVFSKMKKIEWNQNLVSVIAFFFLWSGAFISASYSYIKDYQIFRDYSSYISSIFLVVIIFLILRLNPFSKVSMGCFGAYVAGVVKYMYRHNSDWGPDYRKVLICEFLMIGCVVLLTFRIIENYGKEAFKVDWNVWNVCTFAIFLGAFALNPNSLRVWMCPIVILWLIKIDEKLWEQQVNCIAYAVSISFSFLMTKSLIEKPDAYYGYRYVGIFAAPAVGGVLAGVALACSVYLIMRGKKTNKGIVLFWGIISSLYSMFAMLIMFQNKTGIFGIYTLALAIFVYAKKNINRKCILIRIAICFFVTVGVFFLSYFVFKAMSMVNLGAWEEKYGATVWGKLFGYWLGVGYRIFVNTDVSLFPEGSVMVFLDRLTTGRLTLWTGIWDSATLLGNDVLDVVSKMELDHQPHAHNTFLSWIITHGKILGVALIAWYFSFAYKIGTLKKEGRFWVWVPILWIGFCLGFFVFEREGWEYPSLFFTLVFVKSVFVCDNIKD